MFLLRFLLIAVLLLLTSACTSRAKTSPVSTLHSKLIADPLTKDETMELLNESGKNWFYGAGVGETSLKVAATIVMPVAGLLWISNDLVDLFGYQGLSFRDVLPEESAEAALEGYQGIVSIPGHLTAKVSREEFRNQHIAQNKIESILRQHENPADLLDF